ncbi:MAG: hypothetical protein LBH85_07060 [Treponema sp.]|nr:hypothetical protein [Treponema sp.]
MKAGGGLRRRSGGPGGANKARGGSGFFARLENRRGEGQSERAYGGFAARAFSAGRSVADKGRTEVAPRAEARRPAEHGGDGSGCDKPPVAVTADARDRADAERCGAGKLAKPIGVLPPPPSNSNGFTRSLNLTDC